MDEYWDSDYDFDYGYEYENTENIIEDDIEVITELAFQVRGDEDDESAYWEEEEYSYGYAGDRPGPRLNPAILIVIGIILFIGFFYILPNGELTDTADRPVSGSGITEPLASTPAPAPTLQSSLGGLPADTFIAPYDDYWVTQGVHGTSYGHMAVDIAAGEGAIIRSPIAGQITDKTVDGFGNTVLVIENDFYRITMLHGNYTVEIGDEISWGDKLGEESNHGFTTDMQGRLCTGRDCGYHTHLNVFNKQLGANVNPLDLLSTAADQQLVVGSRVQN